MEPTRRSTTTAVGEIADNLGGKFSVRSDTSGNSNLQDSEFTADSGDGNIPKEVASGWLGGMGADFRNIAHCLTDNVAPVLNGVATIVHRTAVAVANEISQLEQDGNLETIDRPKKVGKMDSLETVASEIDAISDVANTSLMLPWEIKKDTTSAKVDVIPVYFTDDLLMKDILDLSKYEATFLKPFREDTQQHSLIGHCNDSKTQVLSSRSDAYLVGFSSTFVIDDRRIKLIQRLMDIDKNLASMHSRFSGKGKVKEELFWKNYFYHCDAIRNERFGSHLGTHRPTASSAKSTATIDSIAFSKKDGPTLDRSVSSIAGDYDRGDEESLVAADSASDEDSSYVIASAPNSVSTFTTSQSVDDVVVISSPSDSRGKS